MTQGTLFCNVYPKSIEQVAAAGPFSTNDNLAYEPLAEIFAYARRVQPNVLILVLFQLVFTFFLGEGRFDRSIH